MRAETIAKKLGGYRVGSSWLAKCPAHNDSTPSLSINQSGDGKLLAYCHAGCSQQEVIGALKRLDLWGGCRDEKLSTVAAFAVKGEGLPAADFSAAAEAIWNASSRAEGTLVQIYLATRGIVLPPPTAIRFHPNLLHRPSGMRFPAMVSRVTCATDGKALGVHRTYLQPNGYGKAPVSPSKMLLGSSAGGVIRLAEPTDTVALGEGMEDALSVTQITGVPVWAALSASGLANLQLPAGIQKVIILADADDAGEAAALRCSQRWVHEGRSVSIARPRGGAKDFNEMLLGVAVKGRKVAP